MNIDESTIIKSKNKFRESQNKKNVITKIDKTTTRFTTRNFSSFEIVKTKIEIKIKRVKKNKRIKQNIITQNKRDTTSITIRNKQNIILNTKTRTKRNVRTFKIIRAATLIF